MRSSPHTHTHPHPRSQPQSHLRSHPVHTCDGAGTLDLSGEALCPRLGDAIVAGGAPVGDSGAVEGRDDAGDRHRSRNSGLEQGGGGEGRRKCGYS